MATTARMHPLYGLKRRKVREHPAQDRLTEADIATMHDVTAKAPIGQRFDFWLGRSVKRHRELAGLNLEALSTYLKPLGVEIGKEALDRFEKGKSRPRNEPQVIAAIAQVVGLDEPRDFYAEAVSEWYEHGEPPQNFNGDNGQVR